MALSHHLHPRGMTSFHHLVVVRSSDMHLDLLFLPTHNWSGSTYQRAGSALAGKYTRGEPVALRL